MKTIHSSKLLNLLSSIEQRKEVIDCCKELYENDESIDCYEPGNRVNLERIYETRERIAKKRKYIVPGGAELLRNLKQSREEETILVIYKNWSIFLEATQELKCLGCLQGGTGYYDREQEYEEIKRKRNNILSEKKRIFMQLCSNVTLNKLESLINSLNLSEQTSRQILENYNSYTKKNDDFEVHTPMSILRELTEQVTSPDSNPPSSEF